MLAAQVDQAADEVQKILLFGGDILPVHPVDLVILTIGVVVAALAAADFIAGQEHGRPLSQQYCS